MAAREPSWWYGGLSWQCVVLEPLGWFYGFMAATRYRYGRTLHSPLPVICVGNYTVGGTGKTPMALALADLVEEAGGTPWFLSRGYGGRLDGQEVVDPRRHTAAEVGDEPLLLAARAPTVISRDRALGAEFIARQAPDNAVIIMDDGLQNPSVAKDLTIALVDGARGVGNGCVIPAGPLRAEMPFQFGLTDLIILTGSESRRARRQLDGYTASKGLETLAAETRPRENADWLRGARIVAFAGIANPLRFFGLLGKLGAQIVQSFVFPDHATLSNSEAETLLAAARQADATLVTTEKDLVRLNGLDGSRIALKASARPLPITVSLNKEDRDKLLFRVCAALERKNRFL